MRIEPDEPGVTVGGVAGRGVSGGVIGVIAVTVMSLVHGLTPEQHAAGVAVVVGVLASVRHVLKIKFKRFFSFL